MTVLRKDIVSRIIVAVVPALVPADVRRSAGADVEIRLRAVRDMETLDQTVVVFLEGVANGIPVIIAKGTFDEVEVKVTGRIMT